MQEELIEEEAVVEDNDSTPVMMDINGQTPVLPNVFKFYGTVGAECLTQKCEDVKSFDERLQAIVDTLLVTAYYYEALGLAAPQIGVTQRVFVAKINGEYKEFVNPVILEENGESKELEGCVSFFTAQARVKRSEDVVVRAQSAKGEQFTVALDGMESVCVQHETDHLDGVLFIDRMSPLYRRQTLKKTKKTLNKYGLI